MKKVLTIAGSDCSGGAGIQADLKTMSAHGVFAMSVIVSVVAENTARVISIEDISPKVIEDQMDAVFEDIFPDAVKVGMLSTPPCMQAVARKLRQYQPKHLVIDPVMYAKNGAPLMNPDAVGALIEYILPLATVLTPNIPEAECIAKMEIQHRLPTWRKLHAAFTRWAAKTYWSRAVTRSATHSTCSTTASPSITLKTNVLTPKNTHGTGLTLSSAIASNLALGYDIVKAVGLAKDYVTEGIRHSLAIGKGLSAQPLPRVLSRGELSHEIVKFYP